MDWVLDTPLEGQLLEEAILGVVGSIDKPHSPAGEAKHHFYMNLFGRDHALQQAYRRRILEVRAEDLRRVAQTWLVPEKASAAVVTHKEGLQDLSEGRDWAVTKL